MAVSETLGIDFVGSSAGLQDAVMASQRALQALNRDSSRMSFTLGRIMRTIVTPIAGVILSAFAAKRALADFTNSTLPGVNKYNQAMGLMRISMFRLSSAVGELLAPAAARVAGIITLIATNLEPLIRKLAATMPSIAAFFKQMGMNLLAALRPLMPTVFALIEGIIAKFSGISWGSVFETLKAAWNTAWNAILTFMAPILVRLATLIEVALKVGTDLLSSFGQWFLDIMARIADYFGVTLPGAIGMLAQVVAAIQAGIIIAIAALEIGIQNMPLLFQAVAEGANVAFRFIMANWAAVGNWMVDAFIVVAQNIATVLANAFQAISPVLFVVFENAALVMYQAFLQVFHHLKGMAARFGLQLSIAIIKGLGAAFAQVPIWMAPGTNLLGKALLRAAGALEPEVDIQHPVRPFNFEMPHGLKPIPGLDLSGILNGLGSLPQFPDLSTDMEKMEIILQAIRDKFGPGIAQLLQDALNKAPTLAAQILSGLPSIGGIPGGRADQFSAIAPLLFGSREAAMLESNQTSKNPLVPLQLAANAMTAEQLVVMRAQAKAASRKSRIANF